jgi:hypothetical protein
MILELSCFLAAALAMMLPGILLAGWLELGESPVERICHGASLGLAGACYLASLVSHFDLRWFFPLWAFFFLVVLIGFVLSRRGRRGLDHSGRGIEAWVWVVLFAAAVTRFAATATEALPRGWDPAFHMILAEKIRLTHHAITDWLPFDPARLNYPTGIHVLIVLMSWLSGLALPMVFKYLIPLAGVLTTGEIYVLGRRLTNDAEIGLFAAIAYGLWAIDGSIGYSIWGGLPNEMAMLFFVAMLSIWVEKEGRRIFAMGMFYAAVILVHHHVMAASAVVLGVCLAWALVRGPAGEWKTLVLALILAAVLDGFFIVPYAARVVSLPSTHILSDGEFAINPLRIPGDRLGYLFSFAAAAGLAVWIFGRRVKIDPRTICGLGALIGLFVIADYVVPPLVHQAGHPNYTVFTASRFLGDATYFLAVAAGVAAAYLRRVVRVGVGVMSLFLMLLGVTLFNTWKDIATPPEIPDGFVYCCLQVRANAPVNAIVDDADQPWTVCQPWTSYLTWRWTVAPPIPISEPIMDRHVLERHLREVFTGQTAAEPDLLVLQIRLPGHYDDHPSVVYEDPSGVEVVRLWPR